MRKYLLILLSALCISSCYDDTKNKERFVVGGVEIGDNLSKANITTAKRLYDVIRDDNGVLRISSDSCVGYTIYKPFYECFYAYAGSDRKIYHIHFESFNLKKEDLSIVKNGKRLEIFTKIDTVIGDKSIYLQIGHNNKITIDIKHKK